MPSSRTTFSSEFGKANWFKFLDMAEFGKAPASWGHGLEKPSPWFGKTNTMHSSSSLVWKSHCLKWPQGPACMSLGYIFVETAMFFWELQYSEKNTIF